MKRIDRRVAAVAALALGLGLLSVAAPAQAHNSLIASTPAVGSTISELPAAFSITTSEPLLDLVGDGTGFALQVMDATGKYYGDGCLSIIDSTMWMGATLGEPGAYTLVWQVVSEDGHPVSEQFGFTWAPPAGTEVTVGEAAPPVCGVTGVAPTTTATATPTPEPSATPTPSATAEPTHENVPLAPVLWVGGVILALLLAGLVLFLALGRRAKRDEQK